MRETVNKIQWVCCNRLESHPLSALTHKKPHFFTPFQKPNTRERPAPPRLPNSSAGRGGRVPPGHALHASDERTRHACSCSYRDGYDRMPHRYLD
jgi:hypothetical protein